MDFIFLISFWLLCTPVLIITAVAVFTSFHPKIIKKNPNAITLNNFMILIGIGLLITIFVIHSWTAGVVTTIFSIVTIGIAGRIRERIFIQGLINKGKLEEKSKQSE